MSIGAIVLAGFLGAAGADQEVKGPRPMPLNTMPKHFSVHRVEAYKPIVLQGVPLKIEEGRLSFALGDPRKPFSLKSATRLSLKFNVSRAEALSLKRKFGKFIKIKAEPGRGGLKFLSVTY